MRKLETESDAFAFGDKLIEKWYGTVEKGSNKGILLVVTTNKDGALTGGPKFLKVLILLAVQPAAHFRLQELQLQDAPRAESVSLTAEVHGAPAQGFACSWLQTDNRLVMHAFVHICGRSGDLVVSGGQLWAADGCSAAWNRYLATSRSTLQVQMCATACTDSGRTA